MTEIWKPEVTERQVFWVTLADICTLRHTDPNRAEITFADGRRATIVFDDGDGKFGDLNIAVGSGD